MPSAFNSHTSDAASLDRPGAQTFITSGRHLEQSVGIVEDSYRKIVVTDRRNGVIRIDPMTGEQTVLSSGGSFADPFGITMDALGDFWIANSGYDPFRGVDVDGKIVHVDQFTGTQMVITQGGFLKSPYGITYDYLNNKIVVTDMRAFNGQGAVVSIDPSTHNQTLLWGPADANPLIPQQAPLACPMGIVMELLGTFLVTAFTAGVWGCGNAGIYRLDFDNRTQTTVSANPQVSWRIPFGLGIQSDQNLVVGDEGYAAVFRLTPGGQFIAPIPFSEGGYMLSPPGLTIVRPEPPCSSCH